MMDVTIWVAFAAGLISFFSPCVLPLYPAYISYITGISVSKLSTDTSRQVRSKILLHTLFFVIGFSLIFFALGYLSGLFSILFGEYRDLVSQIAGIFIIVMGLFLLGVFKPQLLMREFKMKWNIKPLGYFGSLLIGIGFAAGWTPCIGPILSSILALAMESGNWVGLMTGYSIGFAIPFFVMGFFIGSTRWITKYSNAILKVGGVVLIIMGFLLFTGQMLQITHWLERITPEWMRF